MENTNKKTQEFFGTIRVVLLVFSISLVLVLVVGLVPAELDLPLLGFLRAEKSQNIFSENETDNVLEGVDSVLSENTPGDMVFDTIDPDRVVIKKIGVDVVVLNPQTRDVKELDRALLQGVVHYPGSGGPEDMTNMFLFGHSTTFKNVSNPAYKAFNRLEELNLDDQVEIHAGGSIYVYNVISVSLVGTDRTLVEFKKGKRMLTLATCNTFGGKSKEERIVVEAVYESKKVK